MGLLKEGKGPHSAVPKLSLPQEATERRDETPEGADAGVDSARAMASFEDFWEQDGAEAECDPAAGPSGGGATKIGTPRKGEEPLKIFALDTPPSTPKAATAKARRAEDLIFCPPWPSGPNWPFCCTPSTLEIKSLPPNCDTHQLVQLLDSWGFVGRYNFVHVRNSIAKVNAVSHSDGRAMAGRLHGFVDWPMNPEKVACEVSWCFTCQGLDTLIQEYMHVEAWAPDGSYIGPWTWTGYGWGPLPYSARMWPISPRRAPWKKVVYQ